MKRRDFLFASTGTFVAATALGGRAFAADKPLKIGMLIPRSGPAGLYGPSSENATMVAVEKINAEGGILGRPVEVLFGDAGGAPSDTVQVSQRLWRRDGVEMLIGMHDSASREAVVAMLRGQLPYIYASVGEGGYCAESLYNIATTPDQQLAPVIPWLAKNKQAKNYYFVGNDYVWPRNTNAAAKRFIESGGGKVVGEEYFPFTVDNFDTTFTRIRESGADAVLVTLVGGASIAFNRAFASFGLDKQALRLGTLFDELTLAGIGAENTANLFASGGYFNAVETPPAKAFKAAYAAKFGAAGADVNMLSESCYEGMLLARALFDASGETSVKAVNAAADAGVSYDGPRGTITLSDRYASSDIYLAEAKGVDFSALASYPNVAPGSSCTFK